MGLAKALRDEMDTWTGELMDDQGVKDIRIKMSGCPNGCGLHHIANIGFHGAALKGPGGQQAPAYELFLGGNYGDNRVEDSRVGTRIPRVKVPAKAAPSVLKTIVTYYKANRADDSEKFNQFLDRVGLEELNRSGRRRREVGARSGPRLRPLRRLGAHQHLQAGAGRGRVRRLAHSLPAAGGRSRRKYASRSS